MLQFYGTILELVVHVQSVDTRPFFSPPKQPGYKATIRLHCRPFSNMGKSCWLMEPEIIRVLYTDAVSTESNEYYELPLTSNLPEETGFLIFFMSVI